MIEVSNAWKEARNQTLLPEIFVELSYMVSDLGIQNQATVSGSDAEIFSNMGQLLDLTEKHSEKYATLDYGCWGLDGTFGYSDGTPSDPGYVNKNYSSDDGTLEKYPTVTLYFEERQDVLIPGLSITWDTVFGAWATHFRVRAYNVDSIVADVEIKNNTSLTSTVWVDLVHYNRITIEVLKWSHPYRRVRCSEIVIGIRQIYTKNDLLKYEHSQSVDLLSGALPENKIIFYLRNDDGRWNPDNPSGFEKYLMEQQEVRVRYGMELNGTTEWIKGGTFWLSERTTPANGLEAVFVARDAILFMNIPYSGSLKGTLYDVAVAALTEADLPKFDDGSVRYYVSEHLKSYPVEIEYEKVEFTVAEVLQIVANASNCVFYQDRDGVIRIEPWDRTYSDYMIDSNISYSHPEYTVSKPLKSVSVGYGEENRVVVRVASKGEIQTVDNPFISTKENATEVAENTKEILGNRKVISGDFRADLRMDVLDNVIVASKYASNVIGITDITYSTTGGAFHGTYTGRVVSINLEPVKVYSNEFNSGEIW